MASNNTGNQQYYSYGDGNSGPSMPNAQNGQQPQGNDQPYPNGQRPYNQQSYSQQPQNQSNDPFRDFERLCHVIGDSVSQATQAIGRSLQDSSGPLKEGLSNAGNAINEAWGKTVESYRMKQAEAELRAEFQRQQALIEARYGSSGKLRGGGIVQTAFGAVFSLAFVEAFLKELLAFGTMSLGGWIGSVVVLGALNFISVKGLIGGIRKITLASTLKRYKALIGPNEVYPLADLAARTNEPLPQTLKNVQRLIDRGMFPEGRLDDERTTLILTNQAYGEYLRYRKEQAQREHEELMARQRAEAEAKALGLTPEMQEFLRTGQEYLASMQQLDEAIQDEAVSEKIVAIEGTVQAILDRAKEEPSLINGLGRLMNYYLPTTVKLLNAYDALEEQTVQGETILSSRTEIENTLDVLQTAYEKLLDATFQDLSMDVSSDITVLHTMLAQEGLVDTPFDDTNK